MPLSLAALQASKQIAATLSPSAGVIPVKWNQSAPSKILFQSKSAVVAVAIEEPYVVVDIDTEDEFQIVYKIIQDLKIKTRILKKGE